MAESIEMRGTFKLMTIVVRSARIDVFQQIMPEWLRFEHFGQCVELSGNPPIT
jgi:hypothetical protein